MDDRRATQRWDDHEAHERAVRHLVALMGVGCTSSLRWDPEFHLQGHVEVAGEHLVVIAARDADHEPRVLSERAWDELRHGSGAHRLLCA